MTFTPLEPLGSFPPLVPKDFELQYDSDHDYSFFEDEDANGLYSYGHDRDAEFVNEVNEYDAYTSGFVDDDLTTYNVGDVHHVWAVVTDPTTEQFTWHGVTENTPNAFPVSVIRR